MNPDPSAQLVKDKDPDRYLTVKFAPEADRKNLLAIYAFNLEVARAPWASAEPMIAQMRLQWWADAIDAIYEGASPQTHEILPAVSQAIIEHDLPKPLFVDLIQARHFDIHKEGHEHRSAFDAYINSTAGSVMELAALSLRAPQESLGILRSFSYGAGVANLLRAAPKLIAMGRNPLPDDVSGLVDDARKSLKYAREKRSEIPNALNPALLTGWRATQTLRRAAKYPQMVFTGNLEESPAQRAVSLGWRRLTNRW